MSVKVRTQTEANTEHISAIYNSFSVINKVLEEIHKILRKLDNQVKSLETRLDSYDNTEGEDI